MQHSPIKPDEDRKVACPLCCGKGIIKVLHFDVRIISTRDCDVCRGKGWVERPRG